jgi:hypothetical protein
MHHIAVPVGDEPGIPDREFLERPAPAIPGGVLRRHRSAAVVQLKP